MASRGWWRVHEPRARLALRLERVRAAAGKGVRVDASADVVGLHDRDRLLCSLVRVRWPPAGQAGAADLRCPWRYAGRTRIRALELDHVADVSLHHLRRDCRRRERLRLRHANAGGLEMVSRQ